MTLRSHPSTRIPRLAYKFNKPGRYLVEVRAYPEFPVPPGGPDDCYELLIGPPGRRSLSDSAREKWESLLARSIWREQTFERRLDANRLQELSGRSRSAPANPEVTVIDGVIAQPGESHNHKFKVNAGERLAFELETAAAAPPEFNPLLTVLDSDGRELFNNVYLRIGRNPTTARRFSRRCSTTSEQAGNSLRRFATSHPGGEVRRVDTGF